MAQTKSRVSRRLGDLLVAEGLINQEQLQRALLAQKGTAEKLGSLLVRLNLVDEDKLVGFLSKQYGIPSVTLSQLDIDPDVLKLVPAQMARKYEIVPVERKGNVLTLAMADPTNVFALDDVTFLTNLQVQPSVAPQGAIRKAIERNYDVQMSAIGEVISELEGEVGDVELLDEDESGAKVDIFELKESADEAPIVKLVNMVLVDAIRRGASDIHLEPYETVFRIRFRIDRVPHDLITPPTRPAPALISRVKTMANLDIPE